MRKIEAVIFDWAGTLMDFGGGTPTEAFVRTLRAAGLIGGLENVWLPEEMCTLRGISKLLHRSDIIALWEKRYGCKPGKEDLEELFEKFQSQLRRSVGKNAEAKPYAAETIAELKSLGIKMGSTTDYTHEVMKMVQRDARKEGWHPGYCAFADKKGRPYPYMIFDNMKRLEVASVENIVKVGDTILDIIEGKNAGAFTIAVVEGSAEMGVNKEDYDAMTSEERYALCQRTEQRFKEGKADMVIQNLRMLPDALRMIEKV